MAGISAPYAEKRLLGGDTGVTITDSTDGNGESFTGFGAYPHLSARLDTTGVSGGADTFDCKIQYRWTGGASANQWIDLITFTQATGATAETKIVQRKSDTTWTNEMRVVTACGAGATATGVYVTLVGGLNGA